MFVGNAKQNPYLEHVGMNEDDKSYPGSTAMECRPVHTMMHHIALCPAISRDNVYKDQRQQVVKMMAEDVVHQRDFLFPGTLVSHQKRSFPH